MGMPLFKVVWTLVENDDWTSCITWIPRNKDHWCIVCECSNMKVKHWWHYDNILFSGRVHYGSLFLMLSWCRWCIAAYFMVAYFIATTKSLLLKQINRYSWSTTLLFAISYQLLYQDMLIEWELLIDIYALILINKVYAFLLVIIPIIMERLEKYPFMQVSYGLHFVPNLFDYFWLGYVLLKCTTVQFK